VLLAGGDVAAREAVRHDLAHSMSPDTVIEQVGAVWEVLARAGDSRVVIISGELEDVSAESLMQMLAHRHPGLPVVCLGGSDALQSTPVAC
jgi:DNA-binding NtrC family response regulator